MTTIIRLSHIVILVYILCTEGPGVCGDGDYNDATFGEILFQSLLGIDATQPCELCRTWYKEDPIEDCSQLYDLLIMAMISSLLLTFTGISILCRRKVKSKPTQMKSIEEENKKSQKLVISKRQKKDVLRKLQDSKCKRWRNPRSMHVAMRKLNRLNPNIRFKAMSEGNLLTSSNGSGIHRIYDLTNPGTIPEKVLEALFCVRVRCSFHPHDKIRVMGRKVYHQCEKDQEKNKPRQTKRQSTSSLEINRDGGMIRSATDDDIDIGDPQLCSTLVDSAEETDLLSQSEGSNTEMKLLFGDDKTLMCGWLGFTQNWSYNENLARGRQTEEEVSPDDSLLNSSLDVSDCLKNMSLYGDDNNSIYHLAAVILVKIAFDKVKDYFLNKNQNNSIVQQPEFDSLISKTHSDNDLRIYEEHGDNDSFIYKTNGDRGLVICEPHGDNDLFIRETHGDNDLLIRETHTDDLLTCEAHTDNDLLTCEAHGDNDLLICEPHGDNDLFIRETHTDNDLLICEEHGDNDLLICETLGDNDSPICETHGDSDSLICKRHDGNDSPSCEPYGHNDI